MNRNFVHRGGSIGVPRLTALPPEALLHPVPVPLSYWMLEQGRFTRPLRCSCGSEFRWCCWTQQAKGFYRQSPYICSLVRLQQPQLLSPLPACILGSVNAVAGMHVIWPLHAACSATSRCVSCYTYWLQGPGTTLKNTCRTFHPNLIKLCCSALIITQVDCKCLDNDYAVTARQLKKLAAQKFMHSPPILHGQSAVKRQPPHLR